MYLQKRFEFDENEVKLLKLFVKGIIDACGNLV